MLTTFGVPATIADLAAKPVLFAARIDNVDPIMQTMSMPPQCHYNLHVVDLDVIRGDYDGSVFRYMYVGNTIDVELGKKYIFGGVAEDDGDSLFVDKAMVYSESTTQELRSLCPGWTKVDGALVSPFKGEFPPSNAPAEAPVCSVSKRPAVTAPPAVVLTAEQVIPSDAQEYTNPYGDGQFKITVTNTGSQPALTPVFRDAHGVLQLEASAVVATDGHYMAFPEAPIAGPVEFVTLKPGESVSGVVDTLKLQGVEWPRGGSRVYFSFCYGNLVAANFFYYYSSTHDALVAAK